jgi:hypothetical protein
MMPKRQEEFIHTYETIFAISGRFKHLNFGIKGGTIHSNLPLSFQYCYVVKSCINFLVVKMKGNIIK